ncbi:hypothetical protein MGU_05659 [Metarhizium guizhouense ARSEF 977]|uniref:Ecp2 effector protein-like domain-containing protein n=1 Tax=Metarhizium guizhouense (strain ARSEF 977) TaxID=1276136 RepID=A0A0B4I3M8_METGA|nr:hypothetical protein MGU_05659 [Metarhizium guizhouense ARSEF 977]
MISNKILAYLAFAALIGASPVAITDGEGSVFSRRNSVDDCGASTFENHSSNGSPLVADCRQIAANIANGGTWTVANIGQRQLVQYGTCAFGVEVLKPFDAFTTRIGNQDIIDLINESINRFQWQDKVGAAGNMMCQTESFSENRVAWGLYHT